MSSENASNSNYYSSTGGDAVAEREVELASLNPKKKAGTKKFTETRHPVYRGVRMRDNGKWVCEMTEPNTKFRVCLGTHPTAIMAPRAHDVAALAFRGQSACLNFADSVSRLPVPKSNSIQDIQKAAAEAAEAFRYTEDAVVENAETDDLPEVQFYVDEEEIFEMPGILASMAEARMVEAARAHDVAALASMAGILASMAEAARAHDVAALAFRGQSACLNFADSVWRLPVPKSNSIQDIQKAAAEAAEAFRYTEDAVVENVETDDVPEVQFYVDEEEIFEMPGILASMAEARMVPPPRTVGVRGYSDDVIPSQFHDALLQPNMGRLDYNSPILPSSGTQQHDPPDVTTPGLTRLHDWRFGRFCGAWLACVATYTAICALLVAYTAWKFQSEKNSAFHTHLGYIIMSIAAFFTTLVTSGIIVYSNNDLPSLMPEHFYPVYDVILTIVFCFSAILTPLSYLLLLFIPEKVNWAGYLIVLALFVAILSFNFHSLKRALAARHTNHLGAFQMV